MSARETVLDYYEALRRGEPLAPYFAERSEAVKVGVFSRTVGFDAISEALREQTRTTDDWTVESRDLRVTSSETDEAAWFADQVDLSWHDVRRGKSFAYGTRWSGVLEPRASGGTRDWVFATMHVSAPHHPEGDAA